MSAGLAMGGKSAALDDEAIVRQCSLLLRGAVTKIDVDATQRTLCAGQAKNSQKSLLFFNFERRQRLAECRNGAKQRIVAMPRLSKAQCVLSLADLDEQTRPTVFR